MVLGYCSYLQSHNIPFESWEAKQFNARVFRQIREQVQATSEKMAEEFGPAPIFLEDGVTEKPRRHTTLLAIAPTTSSSAILGQVSPGVEPYQSNYYKAGLAKGDFMRRNPYLTKKLQEIGRDTEDTWRSIRNQGGSVQHLTFLDEHTRNVFKTFSEISQKEIITQAVQRQAWVDQAQSININIPPEVDIRTVNQLIIDAWKMGLKTLYYQRSESLAKSFVTRSLDDLVRCVSCES